MADEKKIVLPPLEHNEDDLNVAGHQIDTDRRIGSELHIDLAIRERQLLAALTHISALEEQVEGLRKALEMMYERYEDGITCYEADDDGSINDGGSSIGNAVKLSFEEEQQIISLLHPRAALSSSPEVKR
jgi:hypothetical protein